MTRNNFQYPKDVPGFQLSYVKFFDKGVAPAGSLIVSGDMLYGMAQSDVI